MASKKPRAATKNSAAPPARAQRQKPTTFHISLALVKSCEARRLENLVKRYLKWRFGEKAPTVEEIAEHVARVHKPSSGLVRAAIAVELAEMYRIFSLLASKLIPQSSSAKVAPTKNAPEHYARLLAAAEDLGIAKGKLQLARHLPRAKLWIKDVKKKKKNSRRRGETNQTRTNARRVSLRKKVVTLKRSTPTAKLKDIFALVAKSESVSTRQVERAYYHKTAR